MVATLARNAERDVEYIWHFQAARMAHRFDHLTLNVECISYFQAARMAHRFDHLTLNPSPEGEGLYSIAGAMVALELHFE